MTQVHISRRFEFLRSGLPTNWSVDEDVIVPKTMVWELERAQVFWELHDGVIDEVPRESTERLRLCLRHRDPRRQFVYVKPNISTSRSVPFFEMARREQFLLLTCPRWSTYTDATLDCQLHVRREKLRRNRQRALTSNDILFLGGTGTYSFDRSFYDQKPYEYGISGIDARALSLPGAPEPVMFTSDRHVFIDEARQRWGARFHVFESLHPADYVRHLSGGRNPTPAFCFQPHGVGLRHAIYECMALGIPSIIPECSYLDDITRRCNIVYSGTLPKLPDRRLDLEQACIDAYETYMTPEAIVSDVIRQLRENDLY